MAITYFRCTNLDKNASSYDLYLKGVAENIWLKSIPVTGVETEVEFNLNEIDALMQPNTYELYAQAISADINEFEHSKPSETLVYTVGNSSDIGDDDTGEEDDNTGSEGGGNEGDNTNQYYTFTIIPNPETATVTLTSTGYTQDGNSITVLNESKVYWKVEAEGYVSQSGEWTVTENTEKTIVLDTVPSTDFPENYDEIILPDSFSATYYDKNGYRQQASNSNNWKTYELDISQDSISDNTETVYYIANCNYDSDEVLAPSEGTPYIVAISEKFETMQETCGALSVFSKSTDISGITSGQIYLPLNSKIFTIYTASGGERFVKYIRISCHQDYEPKVGRVVSEIPGEVIS